LTKKEHFFRRIGFAAIDKNAPAISWMIGKNAGYLDDFYSIISCYLLQTTGLQRVGQQGAGLQRNRPFRTKGLTGRAAWGIAT
jgi:hypothetical protein